MIKWRLANTPRAGDMDLTSHLTVVFSARCLSVCLCRLCMENAEERFVLSHNRTKIGNQQSYTVRSESVYCSNVIMLSIVGLSLIHI